MPLAASTTPDLGAIPTASDVIARHIRDAIASGAIAEGEPIRQDEVAQLFRVSKIPVREALKRLEAEGLVTFQRNRGAVVTRMSEPEIAEMFEARAILESSLVRLSVPHMTAATFRQAARYCAAFAAETDVARWAELNWQFHACLFEDARRPFIVGLIRSIHDRIERYLRVQLTLSSGQKVADREHRAILKACRAGDADGAADMVHAHIMKAWQSLRQNLPRRD